MRILPGLLLLLLSQYSVGQLSQPDTKWFPDFQDRMPTRFLILKSDINFKYSIDSKSEVSEIGSGKATIDANKTSGGELLFPIAYKPNLILVGGLRYYDEQYYFNDIEPQDHPLFLSLDDRNLKKLGLGINGFIHLKGNRSLVVRSTLYLAGDFYRDDSSIPYKELLKGSVALGYAIKPDSVSYFGFGFYAGYKFGIPSIYPALIYSRQFPNKIGFDAMLPQSIKVWKKVSDGLFVYGRSRVVGNSYAIRVKSTILDEAESLQLRQSAIISSIGILKQLNKWLWLEAAAGYTYNLSFKVSESDFVSGSTLLRPNTDYLIKSDVSGAPYFTLSLSLALPDDFKDRHFNK